MNQRIKSRNSAKILLLAFIIGAPLSMFFAINVLGLDCPPLLSNMFLSEVYPESSAGLIPDYPSATDELKFGDGNDLPNDGYLSGPDYSIFWWIHITDTQNVWAHDDRVRNLEYVLNTSIPTIKPTFTINTGDLVDSDYDEFLGRNPGQRTWEWELYNKTFADNGMNYSNFFDIVGNHDIYRDPRYDYYINYSISGQHFKTDQFVVNLEFPWGKYSFYLLSVTEDYGIEFPFALGGYMSKGEMAWFENSLIENKDANLSFAFGHQPAHQVFSALSPSGKMFIPLMKKYGVDFYGCGHEHINTYQNIGGIAAVETQQFQEDAGSYRIVAIDNDGISTSFQTGTEFPVGIITSPVGINYAIGDYDMQKHEDPAKIRALAWDPDGVDSVEWRADAADTWTTMTNVEGPLYEAAFDSSLADDDEHEIEIKITSDSETKIESIVYRSKRGFFFGWNEAIPFIVASFIGIVFVIPLTKFIKRKKNPEKYGRKPGHAADPYQSKLLVMKLIVLLVCPMAFGYIFAESVTAVFSLFMIAQVGFIYTDVVLLFFAPVAIFGVLLVSSHLSKRRALGAVPWLFLSLLVEVFLVVFYILRTPAIGWIAPGYYLCIFLDVLMIKRAVYLRRRES